MNCNYEKIFIIIATICMTIITVLLATLILNLFNNEKYDPCDVNKDGKVSAADYVIVRKKVMGDL